jgi:hypothetical protein
MLLLLLRQSVQSNCRVCCCSRSPGNCQRPGQCSKPCNQSTHQCQYEPPKHLVGKAQLLLLLLLQQLQMRLQVIPQQKKHQKQRRPKPRLLLALLLLLLLLLLYRLASVGQS